jgi:hypothetical protein
MIIIIWGQRYISYGCPGVPHTCSLLRYDGLLPNALLRHLIDSWQSRSDTELIATAPNWALILLLLLMTILLLLKHNYVNKCIINSKASRCILDAKSGRKVICKRLTSWYKILLHRLIDTQQVKILSVSMEPEDSLSCSQSFVNGIYPEPAESNLHTHLIT